MIINNTFSKEPLGLFFYQKYPAAFASNVALIKCRRNVKLPIRLIKTKFIIFIDIFSFYISNVQYEGNADFNIINRLYFIKLYVLV